MPLSEIGLLIRTRAELPRARAAVEAAGLAWLELSEHDEDAAGRVLIGTMHQAKELEFKAAGVICCDEGVLPLQARLEAVADQGLRMRFLSPAGPCRMMTRPRDCGGAGHVDREAGTVFCCG